MTTRQIVEWIVMELEGGKQGGPYTDDKTDRGGATRWGCTQRFLAMHYGRPVSKDEVKRLTFAAGVSAIETEMFTRARVAEIADWRVQLMVGQFAVHSGEGRAVRALQTVLGVTVDGVLGPQTLGAAASAAPGLVAMGVAAEQLQHYDLIVRRSPDQRANLRGWMNRTSWTMRHVVQLSGRNDR